MSKNPNSHIGPLHSDDYVVKGGEKGRKETPLKHTMSRPGSVKRTNDDSQTALPVTAGPTVSKSTIPNEAHASTAPPTVPRTANHRQSASAVGTATSPRSSLSPSKFGGLVHPHHEMTAATHSRQPQHSPPAPAGTSCSHDREAVGEERHWFPTAREGSRWSPPSTREELSLSPSFSYRGLKTGLTKVVEGHSGRNLGLHKASPTRSGFKLSFVNGAIAGAVVGFSLSFWLILMFNVDQYVTGLTVLDKVSSAEPLRCEQGSFASDLNRIAQKWIDRAPKIAKKFQPSGLPVDMDSVVNDRPRPRGRPFVFFHQRKAGGTTLRSHLYDASIAYNITRWIPCHDPEKCRHYNIPMQNKRKRSHPDHAIYAAHMYYADVANQLEFAPKWKDPTAKGMFYAFEPTKAFDCMTNFRNPIDRVVSSWNFRQTVHGAKKSTELSPAEWDQLLPVALSGVGEGNNNEAARVFGNIADERVVNALTAAGNETPPVQAILAANELETVLSRVSNCVVVLLVDRCEDSKTIVGHFFPWFDDFMNCTTRLQTGKPEHRASDGLQPGAEAVIRKHNLIDVHTYNFATTLFEELLQIATRHGK